MVRSRKKEPSNPSNRKEGKRFRGSSSSSGIDTEPIVPIWLQIFIVCFFLFLGFASEHYKKSRSEDPILERSLLINQNNVPQQRQQHRQQNKNSKGKSSLLPEEDKTLEYQGSDRYHVIFSTDCSPYQHWQSYLVYYTAMTVKQPGHVTRIVSGCEPDEAEAMQIWFDENVQYMSSRFHLHLTPHFSQVTDENGNIVGDYKFFNKPFGLKHFLENFPILGFDTNTGTFTSPDDIVILIDPDMPLMRPITGDFSIERETLIAPKRQGKQLSTKVQRGIPFAQTYGLGTQWQKFDLDIIAGPDSPAKDVNQQEGSLYYPVGPPYLGTVHDMHLISQKWTEFVPKVHAQYPYLLAEMYAYCIAAAHLQLRHQLIDSLMVSNPGTGGEGWPLVDKIPPEETCDFAKHPQHDKYALPSVVHLCQRYSVGEEWFFGKRKIPHDIYECPTPLFIEPPSNLALLYDFKKPPNAKQRTPLEPQLINQQTFMVCYLTTLLNEAAAFYKTNICSTSPNDKNVANMEKSRTVADLFKS